MKVCVLGTRGFPEIQGGVERHCECLYTTVHDEDIEFIVFRRRPYVRKTPLYKHIRFIDLPSTKIKGFEAFLHSFLSSIYVLFINPDIVHIHNIGPSLFTPLLRLFGIKVVMTYHSANYEHKKWGTIARNLLLLSEKIAFKTSNRMIFVNRFQLEKVPSKYRSKSVYIPNGVSRLQKIERIDYLKTLNVLPHKYILSVGRITPEKGFDILIRAFKKVNTDYKLVIAGGVETENSYFNELKQIFPSERIVFTGYVFGERLQQLYSHASLYVLSSRNEGFPLVLLEAMEYHLNVLVSDIPASHLVNLNRSDYYPTTDIDELSVHIQKKLSEPISRNYNLDEFNWQKIAEQTVKLFKES